MSALLPYVLCAGALYWISNTYRAFRRNLQQAKSSGLPYICLPVNTFSPFWQVAGPFFIPICRLLPFGLGGWADDARAAWALKHELHRKYGRVFMIVSPFLNVVHVADPDVIMDIVTRKTEFPKPSYFYKIVEVYGKNVVTTDGNEWVKYRRITGPPFSENNNRLVWRSALEQVNEMLHALALNLDSSSGDGVFVSSRLQRDMKTIALHVIADAGFGVSLPFLAADDVSIPAESWNNEISDFGPSPAKGHRLTFAQSIHSLLHHLIPVMVIPKVLLRSIPIPGWNSAFCAFSEFRSYTMLLVKAARESSYTDGKHANLLRALVSHAAGDHNGPDRLTDSEILAHMFVYILAGHETTANALSYAILNLAINDDAQRWFMEQLDMELGKTRSDDPLEWSYDMFESSLSAIAVMNETLRLFPTVAGVPKWTDSSSVALHWNGDKYLIPPKTPVVFNTIAMHRDPDLWGSDVGEFKPQRWCKAQPRKGQFIAFSEGARACLGKKFAQVEFVAVISTIFSRFRVEVVRLNDETRAESIQRVKQVFDSSVVLATLGMTRELPIRFVPR